MAKRIKSNYPKYKFIITANALYCTAPMMNICKNYKYKGHKFHMIKFNEKKIDDFSSY